VGQTSAAHTSAGHQGLRLEIKVRFALRGVDVKEVVLWLLAMMMESASKHYNGKESWIFPHDGESK
jgi:hypothetical protein